MKPNEAPEKIYLTTFEFPLCEPIPQESSNPDTVWSKKPYTDADSIEYTRTDAFIERTTEWLKKNITYTHPRKGTEECVVNLNAFIEAMKGE